MRATIVGAMAAVLAAGMQAAAGPAEAVLAAAGDLAAQPPDIRPRLRYLWHPGPRPAEFGPVLAFWTNSLSRESGLTKPVRIGADVWRIDLDDYRWNTETWEKLLDIDPYFHARLVKARRFRNLTTGKIRTEEKVTVAHAPWLSQEHVGYLVQETRSEVPIIRADWWLVQSSRQLSLRNKQTGAGYYDWLGIEDRNSFFKLALFREADSIKLQLEVRAALEKSGISQQGRQVVRLQALTGPLWITLDVKDPTGKGNTTKNLRRGELKHDAEEHYLRLPNGMPAYFLGDQEGKRQDSAPDFLGPDDSPLRKSKDSRIHVGLACVRCHGGQVLQPVDDWVRRTYDGVLQLQSPDKDVQRELSRQYFSDLQGALQDDRAAFQRAMVGVSGMEPQKLVQAFAEAYHGYADSSVGLETAAREMGCTQAELRAAFSGYARSQGSIDGDLGNLLKHPPQPMPRLAWEELYGDAQTILRSAKP